MADSTVEYPFTDEGLRWALNALGSSADAVAESLQRMGIKGVRGECARCPVAQYLWGLWPALADVNVGGFSKVRVDRHISETDENGHTWPRFERIEANVPDPVEDFIGLFDDNNGPVNYSFLEA